MKYLFVNVPTKEEYKNMVITHIFAHFVLKSYSIYCQYCIELDSNYFFPTLTSWKVLKTFVKVAEFCETKCLFHLDRVTLRRNYKKFFFMLPEERNWLKSKSCSFIQNIIETFESVPWKFLCLSLVFIKQDLQLRVLLGDANPF